MVKSLTTVPPTEALPFDETAARRAWHGESLDDLVVGNFPPWRALTSGAGRRRHWEAAGVDADLPGGGGHEVNPRDVGEAAQVDHHVG